ncbi:MAG: ABC transporter ATP-binding protein/permease [Candidatus Symbiothrix sp.]|jgi:ATP-binding cassette subfamily B protein/subfamily B ATP-binding cassette protein MsbA|nr:ABC transporter ATP-binding protein/permease [Candidatus Symbiothrix sp.]
MKDFIQVLRRFVPPYKGYLLAHIAVTLLSAFFTLISFWGIIPILQILFQTGEVQEVLTYQSIHIDWLSFSSWKAAVDSFQNNLDCYLAELIRLRGELFVLIMVCLYVVVTTIFRTGVMYLSSYFLIPLRTGVVRDIRNQINKKILALPLAFFSEERKGDIMARISGDVNEIESSIMSSLDMLFKNPILIFFYLVAMLLMSWQLTVLVLVVIPVVAYIITVIGKNLKRRSAQGQRQWGQLMSQIEETLSGLRIIKAFNAEEKIVKRFQKDNETFRRTTNKIFSRQQLAHPLSELLGTLTVAFVIGYGGYLILSEHSSISGPSFIYYLTIFYMLINPTKDLSKSVYAIQKGLASMDRVDKILQAESTITDPRHPQPLHFDRSIRYENISFRYRDQWVIKNVDLEIPKGKTVALVGQSGSGKSTLADLLPRFYDVQQGKITIDDTDIRDFTTHDLRQYMGIVNQEAILFNDSFFNNIAFGVEHASMEQVVEAARIANAYEFIMASEEGFDTNIGDRGCKLSGGQRQRISIARAVLKNPPILILDEATSALDTESERLVQDALEKLMSHRTTLIIAHRLSTIKNADIICVMHEGEIVERGTHNELTKRNGYYRKLCEMQSF